MVREKARFALSTNTDDLCDTNFDEVFEELIQSMIGVAPMIMSVSVSVFGNTRRCPSAPFNATKGLCTYTTRIGPNLDFFFTSSKTLIKCKPR